MKDIKDYLPYYIGQYVVHPALKNSRILTGRWMDSMIQKGIQIKPILRRLSDMTEEEIKELIGWEKMNAMYTDLKYKLHPGICINIEYSIDAGDEGVYPQFHTVSFQTPAIPHFHWLLKQGFDLFNLIDAGLAIDAKTTTP